MAVTFNQPAPLPDISIGGPGSTIFPNDLESYLFHITFDFRKFVRRDISDRAFYGPGNTGAVKLPIPANMIDTTAVNWGEAGMGPILGAVIDMGARLRNKSDSEASIRQQLTAAIGNLGGGDAALAGMAPIASIMARLGGTKAAEAVLGVAINPFMTVMFQSPTFKRHQFQWHFAPHSKAETDTLRTILARFRYNMLPSVTNNSAGLLLNYPNMCYVGLYPNNKDLYKFKPCVITSASMNYAPNGPAFFDGTNAPTEVVLTVDLLELEYWIQEDVINSWDANLAEGGAIGNDALNLRGGVTPV